MKKQMLTWRQDGIDNGWFSADGLGAVRSSASYGRAGGWWFLPAWLPDTEEHDIGPFRTKAAAFAEAERLTPSRKRKR